MTRKKGKKRRKKIGKVKSDGEEKEKKIIFIAIKNSYFSKTKSDTSINVHVIVSTFAVSQWIRAPINYIEIFFIENN